MDHARHRAERRAAAGWVAIGVGAGALLGAAAVLAAWVVVAGPPWSPDEQVTTAAQPTASLRHDARSSRSDRAQLTTSPPQIDAAPSSGAPTTPVQLLGDSLAVGIVPYLDAGLGNRPLTTDVAEGRGTATMVSLLSPYAATSALTWVVSLGTNDNPEEFPDQAAAVMGLAGPNRCVIWFDVWRVDTDDWINATLEQLAAVNPNLHVVPWHNVAAAHPEWFSGTDVHPSTAGYAVRGQLAVDAVNRECGTSP
ncbi:MAG: hypothetical protein LH645_04205 [Actinomycetia bacterium]|nr:hypothetical protein [Actinomycetes bacterium]